MKRLGALTCVAATLFAALALTVPLAAQEPQYKADKVQHYTVHDLGTLGGTLSWAYGINNKGSVTGVAFLPGDTAVRAFLWRKGRMTDLGTLGGANSTPITNPNERDEVAGFAETSTPGPVDDILCSDLFFGLGTGSTCVAFLWRNGVIKPLPTLDGPNSRANYVNNRGQVVGSAENSTPESDCIFPFQMKPVMWEGNRIKELPTLSGDTQGYALGINDHGQAVGWTLSMDCTALHAVLWKNGAVTYLGSLGGTYSDAFAINNQGQVIGRSNLSGDLTQHAYLWRKHVGMTDLGTLPGDFSSVPWGIDNKGRIVGTSCDASGNCRAFLWQNGVMTDLNTLIADSSPWFLVEADGINSRGEIAGAAFNASTGELHAFLATPKECKFSSKCDALSETSTNMARPFVVLPENVRTLLQKRQGGRFGVGLTRPQ